MQSFVPQCPRVRLHGFCLYHTPDFSQGATEPEIATFAEGCFWGVEHIFLKYFPPSQNKGILKTSVGYTGGNPIVTYPTYRTVCSGATDHAEALRIEFDPGIVSYQELVGEYRTYCVLHAQLKLGHLLLLAFRILLSHTWPYHHQSTGRRYGDPYALPYLCFLRFWFSIVEYRSAIYFHSQDQQIIAQRVTKEVQDKYFTPKGKKIVTEIAPASQWWDAEDYHQLYLFKNPSGYQCPTHKLHWWNSFLHLFVIKYWLLRCNIADWCILV